MAKKQKIRKRKGSFISPLISVTLVLFLTAIFSILLFYADKLKSYLKENVQVNVIFDDVAKEADIVRLQNLLDADDATYSTHYVSKEEARKIMTEELGEDAGEVLGFNPFPASLEIFFNSEYAEVDSIENFKAEMTAYPFVKEVSYQKVILENIDKNVRIVGSVLLGFMLIFLLIAIVLINNTVRLTMYSERFTIKTMQMVGATKSFIRRPFILKAISFGLLGGILANLLVGFLIFGLDAKIPLSGIGDMKTNLLVAVGILALGLVITGLSSFYSVSKYLRMKLDDLY